MEFPKRIVEDTVSGLGSRIMRLVRSPVTDEEIKVKVPGLIEESENDLKWILDKVTVLSDKERKSFINSFESQVEKLYGDWTDRQTLLKILSSIVGGAIAVLGWVYGLGAPVLFKLVGGCIFAFLAPTVVTGTLVFSAGAALGYGLACWYFSGEDEAKVAKLKALDNPEVKFNNLSFGESLSVIVSSFLIYPF